MAVPIGTIDNDAPPVNGAATYPTPETTVPVISNPSPVNFPVCTATTFEAETVASPISFTSLAVPRGLLILRVWGLALGMALLAEEPEVPVTNLVQAL